MDGLLDHGGVALVEGGAGLGKTALLNECARLIHGLYWLTANMADGQSVLISVDDAQWADSASMRWLAYLAPRLDGLAVAVVVAERATPTARHGAATSAIRSVAGSIRPTLLDAAAAATLVRHELGPVSDAQCAVLWRSSGGNPFYLGELIRSRRAAERDDVERYAPTDPSSDVVGHVRSRIDRLDPEATTLAGALAVLGDGRDTAVRWLEDALSLTTDPRSRAEIAHEVARTYASLFRWVEAVDTTDRALDELGDLDPPLRASLEAELAVAGMHDARRAHRVAAVMARLAAHRASATTNEALATAAGMGAVLTSTWDPTAVAALANGPAAAPNWDTRAALLWTSIVLERFEAVEAVLPAMIAAARQDGSAGA